MCAHALGDTPISSQWAGYDHYVLHNAAGRDMIILFYIMLSWRLLVLTGVWPKEHPEYARSIRRVAQQCAN